MPKAKIQLANRQMKSKRVKFKMGTRSSLVSALDMTNEALLAVVADKSAGRRRPLAMQVLHRRGVAVA